MLDESQPGGRAMTAPGRELSDAELAVALARSAGDRLRDMRAELDALTPAELKQRGDRAAQEALAAGLAAARPRDAVLSEEATDDQARLRSSRVWIIDPLDGTREFSEHRPDWAVHVALWQDGALVAGAVALPGLDVVLTPDPAPGVPGRVDGSPLRIAVSRSRPPAAAMQVAEAMHAELV